MIMMTIMGIEGQIDSGAILKFFTTLQFELKAKLAFLKVDKKSRLRLYYITTDRNRNGISASSKFPIFSGILA